VRKPLAQIAGDDALNPLVDLLDPPLGAHAQPGAGQQAKAKARQQTEPERLTDDMGDLLGLVDIAPEHQHVAVSHAPRDRPDHLVDLAVLIRLDDLGALRCGVDAQIGWQALKIAGDPVTVGGKYPRELYPSGILSQLLVNCFEPALGRQAGNAVQLHGDHAVGSRDQVVIDLPVNESEQHHDEDGEHAGNHQSPVESARAY
jgi:hypothetical protein